MPDSIRVAVSGVLVRDEALLLVEFNDPGASPRLHFNLPGGGVEPGETLHEAVRREIREETTAEVDVGRLLAVWEYVPRTYHFQYGDQQTLRLVFECHLRAGSEPRMPDVPDTFQIGVHWVAFAELATVPLIPPIADRLITALRSPPAIDPFINRW